MHDDLNALVDEMALEAKVGQLIHVGIGLGAFETESGWPSPAMQETIQTIKPGAVRVYGSHDATPFFMAEFSNTLQEWAEDAGDGIPLLISSDCEFGAVDVVDHGTQAYPTLRGRAATGDPAFTRDVSAAMARDMSSFGLNMAHRPVADVNTNPENPVIGVRSAGDDPETVIEYATAALHGVHDEDQIAVTKHFPGHGDTQTDSHHDLPHVTYDRETLMRDHVAPFEALIDEGVDAIMTSHIVVECLDPDRPATLSSAVLTDLLRDELGFDGVVITDSMKMDAISNAYSDGDAAVNAIDAGVDLLLTGYRPPEAIHEVRDAILDAVEAGHLTEARIDASVRRILRLKDRYDLADRRYVDPVTAIETTSSRAHRELAAEAYRRSFSVAGGADVLPIASEQSLLLTGVEAVHDLEPAFEAAFEDVVSYVPSRAPSDSPAREPDGTDRDRVACLSDCTDVAVVATCVSDSLPAEQRQLIGTLAARLPTIVVSLGLSTDCDRLPEGVTSVATYVQDRIGNPDPIPETAVEALVETLTGDVDSDDHRRRR